MFGMQDEEIEELIKEADESGDGEVIHKLTFS